MVHIKWSCQTIHYDGKNLLLFVPNSFDYLYKLKYFFPPQKKGGGGPINYFPEDQVNLRTN